MASFALACFINSVYFLPTSTGITSRLCTGIHENGICCFRPCVVFKQVQEDTYKVKKVTDLFSYTNSEIYSQWQLTHIKNVGFFSSKTQAGAHAISIECEEDSQNAGQTRRTAGTLVTPWKHFLYLKLLFLFRLLHVTQLICRFCGLIMTKNL